MELVDKIYEHRYYDCKEHKWKKGTLVSCQCRKFTGFINNKEKEECEICGNTCRWIIQQ